jgi:hypothetical protein
MLHIRRPIKPTVEQPPLNAGENADGAAAIEAWLNVFVRMLRLPDAQRQAIRSELQEHLNERVRDLLLVGRTETESVRLAIEELGETLQLARRFEAANRPRIRRWLMNLALIGIAGTAVVVSAITLAPASRTPATVFQHQDQQTQAALEQLKDRRVDKTITDAFVEEAVKAITENTEFTVVMRKPELQAVDAFAQALNFEFKRTPLPLALDMIVAELSVDREPIGWRVVDADANVIEIGVKSELDRREIRLVSYDIRGIIKSIRASTDQSYEKAVEDVTGLLLAMVDPNAWVENGGDLAQLQVVGGRMFVQAPKRMHERIEWILAQLRDDAQAAEDNDDQARAQGQPPVVSDIPSLRHLFERQER